jgi:hypothetical protein
MGLRAFKVEDADEAVTEKERDNQLGADLDAVLAHEEARILADISHADDAARRSGGASESLVQSQARAYRDGIFILHSEDGIEELGGFVPECDGERVVVHELLDAFGDAAEKLFAVKDGSKLAADIVEQRERPGLLGMREEKTLGHGIGVTQHGESSEF